MERQDLRHALAELIGRQQDATRAMLETLEAERVALRELNGEGIEQLTRAKTEQLQRLEKLEADRVALLAAAGFGAGEADMDRCLQESDPSGQLNDDWQELLNSLECCQRENRVNGGAIELSRHRLQSVLTLLRGEQNSQPLYGQDGHNPSSLGSRSLGKA